LRKTARIADGEACSSQNPLLIWDNRARPCSRGERLVATAKNSGIALLDARFAVLPLIKIVRQRCREKRLVAMVMDGGSALLDAASGVVLATPHHHSGISPCSG